MKTQVIIGFLFFRTLFLQAQEDRFNGFIFPKFMEAQVIYTSGEKSKAMLNYDAITQQMVFIGADDEVLAIAEPGSIDTIYIQNRCFVPYQKDVFYEVVPLQNGQVLFVNRHSNLVSAGKQGAYGTYSQTSAVTSYTSLSSSSGRYNNLKINEIISEKKKDRYFLLKDGKFVDVGSIKRLTKFFPEYKDQIKRYAKDNAINMNREADVIMILNYCYSLK